MVWAVPQYNRTEVNRAGRELAQHTFPLPQGQFRQTVNNWRSAHSYPLNVFQMTLRSRAKKFDPSVVVSQRIKRLESIHAKLTRDQTDSMRLSQMQDIGGCRAVLKDMVAVKSLVGRYRQRGSKFLHKMSNEKNYISSPKPDGYRSHHLVFVYAGEDLKDWDGLKLEIQIRTLLQHSWATAVEAVGIFTKQALKSNQGDKNWIRFFSLMSTVVAAIEECPSVPDTPVDHSELVAEITDLASRLDVAGTLNAYRATLTYTGQFKGAKYFLVSLDIQTQKLRVGRYKAKESQLANDDYTNLESEQAEGTGMQIVLVSADSIANLKRAYPNYFLDTTRFQELLERALKGNFPSPLPCDQIESSKAA